MAQFCPINVIWKPSNARQHDVLRDAEQLDVGGLDFPRGLTLGGCAGCSLWEVIGLPPSLSTFLCQNGGRRGTNEKFMSVAYKSIISINQCFE